MYFKERYTKVRNYIQKDEKHKLELAGISADTIEKELESLMKRDTEDLIRYLYYKECVDKNTLIKWFGIMKYQLEEIISIEPLDTIFEEMA